MKSFSSLADFRKFYIEVQNRTGFRQRVIDVYHVQVLQKYCVAAAFAIPVLKLVEDLDKNLHQCISRVIDECEAVLADESIYLASGKRNLRLSRHLEKQVRKADDAIVHAGNILNNMIPLMPISERILLVGLRARDICDQATKRKRFD